MQYEKHSIDDALRRISASQLAQWIILTITGGTGGYTLIRGLVKLLAHRLKIVAVTGVGDSGGSQNMFVEGLGRLPASDFLQLFLAAVPEPWGKFISALFNFRFVKDDILEQLDAVESSNSNAKQQAADFAKGIHHLKLGNINMWALTQLFGSEELAFEQLNGLIPIKVYLASRARANLVAVYEWMGRRHTVVGEHNIDELKHRFQNGQIVEFGFDQEMIGNPEVIKVLKSRMLRLIILGPGDVATSVLQAIMAGLVEPVRNANKPVLLVMNLMSKAGQTFVNGKALTMRQTLQMYARFIGHGVIKIILVHKNGNIPKPVLDLYAKQDKAFPVEDDFGELEEVRYVEVDGIKFEVGYAVVFDDDGLNPVRVKVVRTDLMSQEVNNPVRGDVLKRSRIRHDSDKMAFAILCIVLGII